MSGNWRLLLYVYNGRGSWLGGAEDGLIMSGSFNDETRLTPLIFPQNNPVWNTELSWTISGEEKRKLDKSGINQCKLTVLTRDGRKYGYIVLDLRTAKLNYSLKDPEHVGKGEWHVLAGSAKDTAAPEICVFHSFGEVPFPPSPPPEFQVDAMFGEGNKGDHSVRSSAVSFADGGASVELDPETGFVKRDNVGKSKAPAEVGESSGARGPNESQEPPTAPPGSSHAQQEALPEVDGRFHEEHPSVREPVPFSLADPARKFRLVVDVRSFRALRRMPLTVANTVVRVLLPPELAVVMVGAGKVSSALGAPIRTHPPVEVARGTECSLPNGLASLEFTSTVMAMATALAGAPRLTAEIWHRDKFTADTLVGMGSVPMESLLQEPWVDGYAPVLAMAHTKKGQPRPDAAVSKVQVGALRVVMSLEEFGEVTVAPVSVRTPTASVTSLRSSAQGSVGARAHPSAGAGGATVGAAGAAGAGAGGARASAGGVSADHEGEAGRAFSQAAREAAQGQADYEVAWELEVWRQAEEARWKAEQKQKEIERMAALEGEWRRRERAREQEMATHRAEAEALEDRLRAKLAALEDRERRLVGAEESLARRRKELEREMGMRTTEAQQAVRRLQQECEHQLEMERERTCELMRQKGGLEDKLASAESRAEAVEAAFHEYRAAQRLSPEAQLQAQVVQLQAQAADAERRCEAATRLKRDYKEKVVTLAQELARLKQRHEREMAARAAKERRHVDALSVAFSAQAESQRAREEREELQALRKQLSTLQAAVETEGQGGAGGGGGEGRGGGAAVVEAAPAPPPAPPPAAPAGEPPSSSSTGGRPQEAWGEAPSPSAAAASPAGTPPRPEPPVDLSRAAGRSPRAEGEAGGEGGVDAGSETRRLLQERSALLRTGLYTKEDRIIQGLDHQLQRLQAAW